MLKCVYVFVSGCVIYLSIYLFVYSSNILAVMIVRWKFNASHAVKVKLLNKDNHICRKS